MIGPSITIKGEVSGSENLQIDGRVEGQIDLAEHSLTIGKSGRLKADITAKIITVEGEVEGDLAGGDKIVIRQSGIVHGNLKAPRVLLEDGAQFKGTIDMSSNKSQAATKGPSSAGARAPAAEHHKAAPAKEGATDNAAGSNPLKS